MPTCVLEQVSIPIQPGEKVRFVIAKSERSLSANRLRRLYEPTPEAIEAAKVATASHMDRQSSDIFNSEQLEEKESKVNAKVARGMRPLFSTV